MNMYINVTTPIPIQGGGFEDHPREGKIREI